MKRALALLPVVVAACSAPSAPESERFTLRRLGPEQIEVLPSAGQLPFCMAFSASDRGVVRHLTMTPQNEALQCEAGKAIGGVNFRIPADEGPVRIIVVYTDAQIEASPIAAQVREISYKQRKVTGMDLRAPGTVAVGSVDFTPTAR
jgi:hypothetical protein